MTPPYIFFENLTFLETESDGLLLNSCSGLKACSHNLKKGMCEWKKQPPRGVLEKRCSENMKQIYRKAPMPKCDFNKVALHLFLKTPRTAASVNDFSVLSGIRKGEKFLK